MLVTRKSQVTGKEHTLDLPITEAQALEYERGKLVQDAFPDCNAEQREFILTGITPEEWTAIFGESDDEKGLGA